MQPKGNISPIHSLDRDSIVNTTLATASCLQLCNSKLAVLVPVMVYFNSLYPADQHAIDPRSLVYGAGHEEIQEGTEALYIAGDEETQEQTGGWVDDEDADFKSVDELPIRAHTRTLDPNALEFVPTKPTEFTHARTPGASDPRSRPVTPRIEISYPSDDSVMGDINRSQTRQRRQSSPKKRSVPQSRVKHKDSSIPNAAAQRLITALGDMPANLPHAYNVGDRSVPLPSLQTLNEYRAPMSMTTSELTAGPARPGYACTYEGCRDRDRRWDTKSERDHHERKHAPLESRALACEHCGKTFQLRKVLKRHMESVHPASKHVCQVCEKTFSRKDMLIKHSWGAHDHVRRSRYARQTPTTASKFDDDKWSTPQNFGSLTAEATAFMAPKSDGELSEQTHTTSCATSSRSTTPIHNVNAL